MLKSSDRSLGSTSFEIPNIDWFIVVTGEIWRHHCFTSREMILVEFFDDFDCKKLSLLEKDESFLEQSCRESSEQIISEIGELLPSKLRFIVWEVHSLLYRNQPTLSESVPSKLVKRVTTQIMSVFTEST